MPDPASREDRLPVRIALLVGADAVTQLAWDHNAASIVNLDGNNDCGRLLAEAGFFWNRFHLTPNYYKQSRRWGFANYDLICNTITDADLNPRTLAVAERLAAEAKRPVLNAPALVRRTTRDETARRLAGIPGVLAPAVARLRNPTAARIELRMAQAGLRFPIIVRETGTHTGRIFGLVDSLEQMAPLFGARDKEYFLTQFVDYRSPDGLHRKWRIYCIGDEVVIRHVLVAQDWKINASVGSAFLSERADLRAEETGRLAAGAEGLPDGVRQAIGEIRRRIGLDYFGMDCNILPDGRLLLFEVNATMNCFPFLTAPHFAYKLIARDRLVAAIRKLVAARAATLTRDRLAAQATATASPAGSDPTTPVPAS